MARRVMIATMKAKPGRLEELKAAFADMFTAAAAEPGTQAYTLIESDEPDTLHFYEQYEDQDAMDVHMSSPALAAIYPVIGPFLADGSAITGTIVGSID